MMGKVISTLTNTTYITQILPQNRQSTHHQLKDYDVFSVKKLEISPTEKSASKIPKVRGGGSEAFGKNPNLSHIFSMISSLTEKMFFSTKMQLPILAGHAFTAWQKN